MEFYELMCKLNWIWFELQKIEKLIEETCGCDGEGCCEDIKNQLHECCTNLSDQINECCENLQIQISELSSQVQEGNNTINSTLAVILSNQQNLQNQLIECCEGLTEGDVIINNKLDELLVKVDQCCDECIIDFGEWNKDTKYPRTKDGCRVVVSYEGKTYQALKQSKGKVPPNSPLFWALIP